MKRITLIFALVFAVHAIIPLANAQLRRANRALDNQNYEEAMSLAQELLADKPDDHKTWDLLARVHDAKANQSTLMGSMEEYLEHVKAMVDANMKVAELRPREAQNVMNRLQIFYYQTFNSGIEEFSNAQAVVDDEDLRTEHFRKSAKYFHASSVAVPDSSGPYINWAYALLGAGDSDQAIKPLNLALQYGGPDPEIYSYLARIYLTTEQADQAVGILEEATTEYPDNQELQNYLLNAYSETGQDERALQRYAEAVENNPNNQVYRYNYGSLLLQSDMFDEAIEQLQMAIDIDERYIDAYYNLGAAYINKANAVQQKITELDDDMRARRDEITDEEEGNILAEIDVLSEERRGLYEFSIVPLEDAKMYAEMEEGRSVMEICAALFQAYAQTNQMENAELVQECAGM
ncbi:MAG: tetratricopeptide repeat protein [Bacteroidetes bacterium]|nr:tetratricopeptide repeat protein [Bacteroidota bacterium]